MKHLYTLAIRRAMVYTLRMAIVDLLAWLCGLGKTQKWLASELGVSRGLVTHWIKGRCKPGRELRAALAKRSRGAVPARSWT